MAKEGTIVLGPAERCCFVEEAEPQGAAREPRPSRDQGVCLSAEAQILGSAADPGPGRPLAHNRCSGFQAGW